MDPIEPLMEERPEPLSPKQLGKLISRLEGILEIVPVMNYSVPEDQLSLQKISRAFGVTASRLKKTRKDICSGSQYPISKPSRIPYELDGEKLAEIEFVECEKIELDGEIEVFESELVLDPGGMTFCWPDECQGEGCKQKNAKARALLLEAGFRELSVDDYGEEAPTVEVELQSPEPVRADSDPEGGDAGQGPTTTG